MQVDLGLDVCEKVQSLTSIELDQRAYKMFADWLVSVGVQMVKASLEQHPEVQFGDLVMAQFRDCSGALPGRVSVDLNLFSHV